MKTFIHKAWKIENGKIKNRDYECTNVICCQGETAPNDQWQECKPELIKDLDLCQLWIENNVKYFGKM